MARETKELLLAAIELIDRDLTLLQNKESQDGNEVALTESEALKLCRYAAVLQRLNGVDGLKSDDFADVKDHELDALVIELVEKRVKRLTIDA